MIQIKHLNKHYKKKQVLFDFMMSMEIEGGKIYGLLGPNGAGKTTIIKIMAGLLNYTSGSIAVNESAQYTTWCKNNVALIPDGERGMRYKNTVHDNVLFFAALKGVSEKNVKNLITNYAEVLNFSSFLNRKIESLSMGEKKKAMLLCGLCTDVKIIIMDEPSNGLDLDAQMELKQLIKMLAIKLHKTFLISSHNVEFLSDLANHYFFMFHGKNTCEIDNQLNAEQIKKLYIDMKEKATFNE